MGDSQSHPAETSSGGAFADVASRSDLTGEKPLEWTSYETPGPDAVRVHFSMGDPVYSGIRSVVEEDAARIRIMLFVGTVPGAPEVCTMVLIFAATTVITRDPVGTRTITHGQEAELRSRSNAKRFP